jgi:hypothetical protein
MNKTFSIILRTLGLLILIFFLGLLIRLNFSRSEVGTVMKIKKSDTTLTVIQYIDSSKHTINKISEFYYTTKIIHPPVKIDTQAVILDYYSRKTTKDFYEDSNLKITIYDTMFKNSITGRSLDYQILKANTTTTSTITNTITNTIQGKPKGLYVGATFIPSAGLYPNVSYIHNQWQIGAGFLQVQKQSFPLISIQFKIK